MAEHIDWKMKLRSKPSMYQLPCPFFRLFITNSLHIVPLISLSWSEQVGVAVGLLMNQNRMDCLEWIQKVLTTVSKERENVLMGAMDKARLELNWDEVSDPFDEEMEAQKSSVKRTTSYEEYGKLALFILAFRYVVADINLLLIILVIKPEEETIQVALRSSAALKLLMRLLDFEESKGMFLFTLLYFYIDLEI